MSCYMTDVKICNVKEKCLKQTSEKGHWVFEHHFCHLLIFCLWKEMPLCELHYHIPLCWIHFPYIVRKDRSPGVQVENSNPVKDNAQLILCILHSIVCTCLLMNSKTIITPVMLSIRPSWWKTSWMSLGRTSSIGSCPPTDKPPYLKREKIHTHYPTSTCPKNHIHNIHTTLFQERWDT